MNLDIKYKEMNMIFLFCLSVPYSDILKQIQ